MTRILLAFDGSDGAVGTVTALSHWNLHAPTDLFLLTVTPSGEWPEARVSRMREVAARSLRRRGAAVHLLLREGDPTEAILDAAREHDADLIAMGPRKQTTLSRLLLGSVTREVMHACRCAIFVGRLSLATERALVVLTGPEDLALIATRLKTLPLPERMELLLLGIGSELPVPCHEPPASVRHASPEKLLGIAQAEERDHLRALLERSRTALQTPSARIMTETVLGNPIEEVLRMERRATPELIMVRNTGDWDGLVAEARSSVLLLR